MSRIVRKVEDVLFRRVADEGLVVRQEHGDICVLNATGARAMEMMDGRPTKDLSKGLAREFGQPSSDVESHLNLFIDQLRELGIVEEIDGADVSAAAEPMPSATDATVPSPYVAPEVLFQEPMEVVAASCTPSPPAKGSTTTCPAGPVAS